LNTDVTLVANHLQTLWVVVCAALVLFMQAGFCCLEAGAVRQKNSINVAVKNVVDLCASLPAFFVIGYALMFGSDRMGIIGSPVLFLSDLETDELSGFLYQAAFCATAATIVSGAVAERCRFLPYLLVTTGVSLVIYPVFGHWVWGGGFLQTIGYRDFAGSSVVHMVGAGVALAGIQAVGAREGRFDAQGRAVAIPGSSMPLVALGVMILLLGWVGFNGGSAPLGEVTPVILVNTLLAACFGGLGAMLLAWAWRGVAEVGVVFNGLLGGLVAITACADVVEIQTSAGIGVLGGFAVVFGATILERLEIDDAVGAVPVHGFAGIVGILSTGLFCSPEQLLAWGVSRLEFVAVQVIGMSICIGWSYYAGSLLWYWVGRLIELRVDRIGEGVGMNFSEHQIADPAQAVAGVRASAVPSASTALSR